MDNQQNKPTRPKRQRVLRNGIHVLQKRPDAAANARTPAFRITHGGTSRMLREGRLDRRITAGKLLDELLTWWADHLRLVVGRDLTRLEQEDAADAARVELLKRLAWTEIANAVQQGDHTGRTNAVTEYLRARRELAALRAKYDAADASPTLDIAEALSMIRRDEPIEDVS